MEYLTMEEAEGKFGKKGVANAGLTLGIIGTALAGLGGVFGGSGIGGANTAAITQEYYQGQISNIKELFEAYKTLDNKIVDSSFALYKNQRDNKDELLNRIAALEVQQAVNAAVDPWRAKVTELQVQNIANSTQNALALETERRMTAENTLVNYMNNMFYPVSVANVTVGTTSTAKTTYNPLAPVVVTENA
jgi:hypothetical protein